MFNKFKSVFFLVVTLTKLAVGGKTTHFFSCCFFFFTPRQNKKTIFCSLPSSSLFHFRNVFVSRVAAGEKKNRAEDLRSWNQNRVLESLLDWYKQERLKSWSCQANYCCFEQNWHKQSLKFKMWFEEVFIWIRGASATFAHVTIISLYKSNSYNVTNSTTRWSFKYTLKEILQEK